MTGLRGAVGLLCLLLPNYLFGQGVTLSDLLAVKNWNGTFSMKAKGSGSSSTFLPVTWSIERTISGTMKFDRFDNGIFGWVGTVTGAISINEQSVTDLGGCTMTVNWAGTSPIMGLSGQPASAFLTFDLPNFDAHSFYFSAVPASVKMTTAVKCPDGDPVNLAADSEVQWDPSNRNMRLAFPASGLILSGKAPLPYNIFGFEASILYDTTWNIVPGAVDDLEVLVEPEDYRSWLPRGGPDEKTTGNTIKIKATLQTKSGKTPNEQARKFVFELADTSRQPGVDINYPPAGKATRDPDLKFDRDPKVNPGMRPDTATESRVETRDGQYTTASAVVSCYDWGAYGRLRVTAVLEGREIVGYWKEEPNEKLVRLPKRQKDSFIADTWKEDKGVTGRADNDDTEEDPVGDKAETGHLGDGLTLYEEYRGYHENGEHKDDLDPIGKDFFIRNRSGGHVGGILLFAAATRFNVHHQLLEDELSDRVINFNHAGDALHQVDQHGVIVVVNPGRKGSACAVPLAGSCEEGHPSTPKDFRQVELPASGKRRSYSFEGASLSYLSLALAHELLHTANVYHHGDIDLGEVTLQAGYVDGVLTPREYPPKGEVRSVRVVREDGSEVPASKLIKATSPYVGNEQGQHSGWEACLMRYDSASLYIREATPGVRYVGGNERLGVQLCSRPDGTGVNDPNQNFPRPRFGNAGAGRGRCRFQLCINDRYDHAVK